MAYEKGYKKSTTKGVIDIAAMGKAGEGTGLVVEKKDESIIPQGLKNIGNFVLNTMFRASELESKAMTNLKTTFGETLLKDYILDNTNVHEELLLMQEEIVGLNSEINKPINILPFIENSERVQKLKDRKFKLEQSVKYMDKAAQLYQQMKTDIMGIVSGVTNDSGDQIIFAGGTTANQRLLSGFMASDDLEKAIIWKENEQTGINEMYINLELVDWDSDGETGTKDDIIKGKSVTGTENMIVSFNDLIDKNMFATASDTSVNNDFINDYFEKSIVLGSNANEFARDMNSQVGLSHTLRFTDELNNKSKKDIRDMFFRIEMGPDGMTFAEIYVENTTLEDLKKELGKEDDYELTKLGVLELLKESANIGGLDDFTHDEMKGIIEGIVINEATNKNALSISAREEYEDKLERDKKPWNQPGYVSHSGTRSSIKTYIATSKHEGNTFYTDPSGTKWLWKGGDEVFVLQTAPTNETYWKNPNEFANMISGEKNLVKKGKWWK